MKEGCKLQAVIDGVGDTAEVHLFVVSNDGEGVAMLDWPKSWPERVKKAFLETAGFEVIIA